MASSIEDAVTGLLTALGMVEPRNHSGHETTLTHDVDTLLFMSGRVEGQSGWPDPQRIKELVIKYGVPGTKLNGPQMRDAQSAPSNYFKDGPLEH